MTKRILVVDDDAGIVEATKLVLEDEGYDVEAMMDGEKVLKITDNYPDLILLDIWLSGTDGREIAKQLKNSAATKDIPLIMFSANRDCADIALEVGAEDCLIKPFDIDELLKKVAKYA